MKYKGKELKEITELQIFDPPKEMLVWDTEESEPLKREVCAIIKHKKLNLAITTDIVYFCHCAEIPEEPKPRRATNMELAKWLAQGKGEKLYDNRIIEINHKYDSSKDSESVNEYTSIRKWEDTDWHEPTVDYMGIECSNVTPDAFEGDRHIAESDLYTRAISDNAFFKENEIKIGNQVWMNKNLDISDGGEGVYFNKENGECYYTWEAAKRISTKIRGWHLPSREEWDELVEATGNDATNLRAESWEGTDKYGFSAVPAGYWYNGFSNVGSYANFWTSEPNGSYAWSRYIGTGTSVYERNSYQYYGFSVRLVKDK